MTEARPRIAAIIGGGVIGGGWAARFLLNGWDVRISDPSPSIREQIEAILANARASLPALCDVPMPPEGKLSFAESLEAAVAGADWIQESVPERLDLKHTVIDEIQAHARTDAIVGSSTSGYKPSELRANSRAPEQVIVAHPFNPVYLLPLVELVDGREGKSGTAERASRLLRDIGMHPLKVRAEIDAHIADRFLEAVWREALWLVKDDVATTAEIDDAIRFGFGLRWAQMGLFETYRLAGGEEGMAHFIRQFGPALKWPWTKLMDVPELDEALVQKIAEQSDAQSGQYEHRELERLRDRNLVGILRSLKDRDFGAGKILRDYERGLRTNAAEIPNDSAAPMHLLDLTALPAWIDYNGHMTEFRYAEVFSDSCQALLQRVDMLDDYVATGYSWYTAETHAQFFDEVAVNQPMYSTVQILNADEKRLHVFYRLHAGSDDRLLASMEAMYLHVHMASGKVVAADADAAKGLLKLAAQHEKLNKPENAGRIVGQR